MTQTAAPDTLSRLLQHREDFLRFLEKRTSYRALAEDILQAAFVKAVQHQGELKENESAVAWFYRMLRNAVIDHYRSHAAGTRALEQWAHELERTEQPDPSTHESVCRCVTALFEELKPEYREALRVVDIEGQSLKGFAGQSGISESNAAVRAHRARRALRKAVLQACGACADQGCLNCGCIHEASPQRPAEPSRNAKARN